MRIRKSGNHSRGRFYGNFSAADYHRFKSNAKKFVEESYGRPASGHEPHSHRGAGSPAEISLRRTSLKANMAVAHMADAPVLQVGDD